MKFFSFLVLFALVLAIAHAATAPETNDMDAVAEVKDEIAQDVDVAEDLDTTAKVAEEEDIESVDDSEKEVDEMDEENMEENSVKSYSKGGYYGKCKKYVCYKKKYCDKVKCGFYYKTYPCYKSYYRQAAVRSGYGYHKKVPKYCKKKVYKYCDKCYYKPYCYYKEYSCYKKYPKYAKYPYHKKW